MIITDKNQLLCKNQKTSKHSSSRQNSHKASKNRPEVGNKKTFGIGEGSFLHCLVSLLTRTTQRECIQVYGLGHIAFIRPI